MLLLLWRRALESREQVLQVLRHCGGLSLSRGGRLDMTMGLAVIVNLIEVLAMSVTLTLVILRLAVALGLRLALDGLREFGQIGDDAIGISRTGLNSRGSRGFGSVAHGLDQAWWGTTLRRVGLN